MLSGVVQAFSEEVKGIRAMIDLPLDGIPWETLGPEFGKAQKKVVAAAKYLDPLLIGLKKEETKVQGARPQVTATDLFSAILPGMAVMFLLFIVQVLMLDLLSDREDGKLRRMMTTPLRPLEIIAARIAGGWITGLAVLLVIVAVGTVVFHMTLGPFGSFLLLAVVASFWTAAFFALFHALVRNRNQAGALAAPIILAFSLFGGSMMSPEVMPRAFRAVGILTPNRWFVDGATVIREGGFPLASLIVFLASGLVLLSLAVPALRRRTSV
jgi:ABC-type multidrug transport system permease subunit